MFITVLAHAAEGTIGRELTGTNGFVGPDKTHWTLLYTAGWCAVAVGLLVLDREFRRGRSARSVDRAQASPALA